jgi:hypothetical protein
MKLKDYQAINLIPTGATYEFDLAKYFKIDTNKSIYKVRDEIKEKITVPDWKFSEEIDFNGKKWKVENDLLSSTFEQWIRLETLIAEDDNIKNLHKLLAIYLRPVIKNKWYKKPAIEPFILDKQDDYAEELLELPVEIASSLVLFFYQNVPKYLNAIKIHYLNEMNNHLYTSINKK